MAVDITAVKPASQPGNPSWATNGGTRVAPTLGQKQSGWTDGQRPPFNVFNWLLGFLSDWSKWSEDAAGQLDSAKLSRLGASATTPQGMIGTLSSERNLTDDCGAAATRWATTWSGLFNASLGYVMGAVMQLTDKLLKLDATADTKNTARTNTLTSRTMPKVWGHALTNGAAGITRYDGANLTTVACAANDVRVTIADDMADDGAGHVLYAVVCSAYQSGGNALTAAAHNRAVGTFDISVFDAAGVQVDLSAIQCDLDFVVFGVQ
jgi:hypothetical protein